MSKKFPNRFNIYKNCRSVYFFTKQRNGLYKIVNKVKNGYNKFANTAMISGAFLILLSDFKNCFAL